MSIWRKSAASAGIAASNVIHYFVRRAASAANVLEISLSGEVVEEDRFTGLIQRFFPQPLLCMRDLLSALSYAEQAENLRAVLLRVSSHDLGWGRAMELCHALKRVRASGKQVFAFLEEPENIDTLIAAACDRVAAPPGATFYLTGLASEVLFFKEALDKLEVHPELFSVGKFKSGIESYTRKSMSKASREALSAVIDSIFETWVGELCRGRSLPRDQVLEAIDKGPWMTEEAKEAGFIDALLYPDQLEDFLEEWMGVPPVRIPMNQFLKIFAPRPRSLDPWREFSAIGLVTAAGPIHAGESRYYGPGDSTVGADTLRRSLARLRDDDNIKAVVMRIDSPGGSAAHSDLIWREVERLREAKPVVVSMGDVAASGGYYIAMAADHIVASPATLTGSIGVMGGRFDFKGLYNKLGISKERISRGKHAAMHSDYGPLQPELKKKIKREMETIYRLFVEKAASARKKDFKEMDKAAQGRVWTGAHALELGLVDELGNLFTAIERAKERAGIPPVKRVPVFMPPRVRKFALPAFPFSLPFPSRMRKTISAFLHLESVGRSQVLALMPFVINIK